MLTQSDLASKYTEIESASVIMKQPVLWGDMDSAKHVNNLVYLKWIETSRIELFRLFMDTSLDGKQGPILGWQDCKYIFPITYPDSVIVTCGVADIITDRFIVESKVYSLTHGRIAAISKQSIIPYDYLELKKIDVPEDWKNKLQSLKV